MPSGRIEIGRNKSQVSGVRSQVSATTRRSARRGLLAAGAIPRKPDDGVAHPRKPSWPPPTALDRPGNPSTPSPTSSNHPRKPSYPLPDIVGPPWEAFLPLTKHRRTGLGSLPTPAPTSSERPGKRSYPRANIVESHREAFLGRRYGAPDNPLNNVEARFDDHQ